MTAIAPVPHGGDLGEARRLFPQAPEPWIDLSTGISPFAYPVPHLSRALRTALPTPGDVAALEAAAARCYGVPDPACVVAVPGTQAAIQWLPRLTPPVGVAVLGPTYAEHARAWTLAGHEAETVPSPDALAAAAVAVVVNPNNPDGRRLGRDTLLAAADARSKRGWLVVDEAFSDVAPEASLAAEAGRAGLVILRSFGKFFGLAGIRLGFVLAPAGFAAELRAAIGPWAIAGETIAIGQRALADETWQMRHRHRLRHHAARLDAMLAGAGLEIAGGTDLFRLARSSDAPALFRRLSEAGVWVRRFPDRPELLRFGLPGSAAATARLRASLQAWHRS